MPKSKLTPKMGRLEKKLAILEKLLKRDFLLPIVKDNYVLKTKRQRRWSYQRSKGI